MAISPLHDAETLRQQKNVTSVQKRTNSETREGVLVNSFIKDCPECEKISLNDTMDTLVISNNTLMPEQLKKKDKAQELLGEAGVTYTNVIIEDYEAAFPKVSGYPTTYVVDSNGVIVSIVEGADFEGYKTAVEEALKAVN